jgi:hypothetical protein
VRQTVRPFDGEHTILHADFLEPEIVGRRALKPIQVSVIQGQSVAAVLMHERERRAADLARIDSKSLRETTHKRRLPRPEIA